MSNDSPSTAEELVEEFQCPGCVCGSDVSCGEFKLEMNGGGVACSGHVLGTFVHPGGTFALGLPKSFNHFGKNDDGSGRNRLYIWMYPSGSDLPCWDYLNIAIWAQEIRGFLFVRSYAPRIDESIVQVIEGGNRQRLVPNAIDVGKL